MSRRRLFKNVGWNWAGILITMASSFVVTPHLIRKMGNEGYGIWVLVGSLISYLLLLDLGVKTSVGRLVAQERAKGDLAGVNAVVSTSMTFQCGVALAALLLTALAELAFFKIFTVGPEYTTDTRIAVMLIGMALAISYPAFVFDGILWGYSRFDIQNLVGIPTTLLQAVLMFWMVNGTDGDLSRLASTFLITGLLSAVAKGVATYRVVPGLRIRLSLGNPGQLRSLLGFSSWYFLLSITQVINLQALPFLAGSRLSVAAVTPVNITMKLLNLAQGLLSPVSSVLTPISTEIFVKQDHARQQRLHIEGGKFCLVFALFFAILFCLMGDSLIYLWIRRPIEGVGLLLAVMAIGEVLPMAQNVSNTISQGMGKHRGTALIRMTECVLFLTLGFWLARSLGLLGLVLLSATTRTLLHGVCQLVYTCRMTDLGIGTYLRKAMLPPLLAAIFPTLLLEALLQIREPRTWILFVGYGVVYGLAWTLVALPIFGVRVRDGAIVMQVPQGEAVLFRWNRGPSTTPAVETAPEVS
jgi:O-antigen/teichoic acid export membrane protein